MPDILTMLDAAQTAAQEVTQRHKKQASFRLYGVLADTLAIVERADRDPTDRERLNARLIEQPHAGNRRYVERGSGLCTLVCRYVFHGSPNRANLYRYAEALRQAQTLQLNSENLVSWLKANGGVNALYFRRPIEPRSASLRVLRLLTPVSFPKDADFTLTLRWTDQNAFRVVAERAG